MDLNELIAKLTELRDQYGGDKRVLWWEWEPGEDFSLDDVQNIEAVQLIGNDVCLS